MKISKLFDEFLNTSTAHGLNYLTSYKGFITRLIWVTYLFLAELLMHSSIYEQSLCFFGGAGVTMYLMSELYLAWESVPVMATIDNLAVPVAEMPYPTITVCPHESPVDNWAMVEKVLNALAFEGDSSDIRNRLDFFLSDAAKIFMETLLEDFKGRSMTRGELSMLSDSVARSIKDLMMRGLNESCSGLKTKLKKVMINNISNIRINGRSIGEFKEAFDRVEIELESQSEEDCNEEDFSRLADELTIITKEFFNRYNPPGLGYIVSTFAPEMGQSFRKVRPDPTKKLKRKCDILTEMEVGLHRFLSEITFKLGIGDGEFPISLFELPAMLEPTTGRVVKFPSYRDNFPFTMCHRNGSNEQSFEMMTYCYRDFGDFITGKGPHPCDINPNETKLQTCCLWSKRFGTNLTAIMTVMKHALHRGRSDQNVERDFLRLAQSLGHKVKENLGEKEDDPFKMTRNCHFSNSGDMKELVYNCDSSCLECLSLHATPTNKGVCYAFNAPNIDQTFVESRFTEAFSAAFLDEMVGKNSTLIKGEGGEENLGLHLTLDRQTLMRSDWITAPDYPFGSFQIGINSAQESFNMRSETIIADIGKVTEILVTPAQYLASDNIRPLDIRTRACRFADELPEEMKMFKYYSQVGCHYECLLRKSREQCRCTPWSYPTAIGDDEDKAICDLYGHYCFDQHMRDLSQLKNCDCDPDCERTLFTLSKTTRPIQVEDECSLGGDSLKYIYQRKPFLLNMLHAFNLRRSKRYFEDLGASHEPLQRVYQTVCRKMMREDVAKVHVRIARETFTRTKQRLRNTLADKIADFGMYYSITRYIKRVCNNVVTLFRWHFGTLYWHEFSKFGRNYLLDLQRLRFLNEAEIIELWIALFQEEKLPE